MERYDFILIPLGLLLFVLVILVPILLKVRRKVFRQDLKDYNKYFFNDDDQ